LGLNLADPTRSEAENSVLTSWRQLSKGYRLITSSPERCCVRYRWPVGLYRLVMGRGIVQLLTVLVV
jgi:hypothetical protein